MDNIVIKKAETIEELKKCNNLLEKLINYESSIDEQINGEFKIENHYEKIIDKNDSIIFIAVKNSEIIGYVMAYKQKENPAVNQTIISVLNVFIDEKYRGKKIGQRLMKEIENWASSFGKTFDLELDCIKQNANANKFYESLGFKPIRVKYRKSFR